MFNKFKVNIYDVIEKLAGHNLFVVDSDIVNVYFDKEDNKFYLEFVDVDEEEYLVIVDEDKLIVRYKDVDNIEEINYIFGY